MTCEKWNSTHGGPGTEGHITECHNTDTVRGLEGGPRRQKHNQWPFESKTIFYFALNRKLSKFFYGIFRVFFYIFQFLFFYFDFWC